MALDVAAAHLRATAAFVSAFRHTNYHMFKSLVHAALTCKLWAPSRRRVVYPLVILGPLAARTLGFASSMLEYMSERLMRDFESQKGNPFETRGVRVFSKLEQLASLPPGPKVRCCRRGWHFCVLFSMRKAPCVTALHSIYMLIAACILCCIRHVLCALHLCVLCCPCIVPCRTLGR